MGLQWDSELLIKLDGFQHDDVVGFSGLIVWLLGYNGGPKWYGFLQGDMWTPRVGFLGGCLEAFIVYVYI